MIAFQQTFKKNKAKQSQRKSCSLQNDLSLQRLISVYNRFYFHAFAVIQSFHAQFIPVIHRILYKAKLYLILSFELISA